MIRVLCNEPHLVLRYRLLRVNVRIPHELQYLASFFVITKFQLVFTCHVLEPLYSRIFTRCYKPAGLNLLDMPPADFGIIIQFLISAVLQCTVSVYARFMCTGVITYRRLVDRDGDSKRKRSVVADPPCVA